MGSYKFLGVTMQQNGSFEMALVERKNKAMGALGALKNVMSDGSIEVSIKEKIFRATVESILMYGAEVWGREPTEEIEKPTRAFYKALYGLPKNTPNYFLKSELGVNDCASQARRKNLEFLRRVRQMEDDRLPKVVLEELGGNCEGFLENRHIYIEQLKVKNEWEILSQARGYIGGASRMLYQSLEHGTMVDQYRVGDTRENGTFLRARLEMIRGLGYVPYQRNEPNCHRCGALTRDDVVHFLGKCTFFKIIRKVKLGSEMLKIEELRGILNNFDMRDRITEYVSDMMDVSNALGMTR